MKPHYLTILMLCLCLVTVSAQQFSLEEAVQYGLENSNNIKMRQLDIASAKEDIKDFRSIGIPQVTGGIDYSYYFKVPVQPVADFISPAVYGVLFQENVIPQRDLGTPETFEFGFIQPHNLTGKIDASFLLFDGSYKYGLKAARLYKELVNRQLEQTEQEIKTNVTKAYMAILITQQNQEIVNKNIKVLEKSLSDTKAIFENGFAESLDVDRLQLSLNGLKTQASSLVQIEEMSKNMLKFQMGYPGDQDITLTEDIEILENRFSKDDYTGLGDIDYNNRAEYQLLNTTEELNVLDMKRYKSGYLPSARAFASAQESLQRTNLFDGNEAGLLPTVVAGVSISVPIYDGGKKSAQIQKSKLQIEQVGIQKEEFERGMILQVTNANIAYLNAKEILDNKKESMALSQKIYDKTQIKFKEGVGSSVELIQAEAALYQEQGAYVNALYELLTARVDLDIALGKL